MADHSTCLSPTCGAWADGAPAACPKCGGPMRVKRGSTARGWVLLFLGLFLVGFMGVITLNVAPTLLYPGKEVDGGTFTGTAEDARMIFALFGLVILIGLTSLLYGIFQIATRRESKAFIGLSLLLAAALILLTFFMLSGTK